MAETERTSGKGTLIPTIRSADINAVMNGIGSDLTLQLEDEVQDLAGVLNNDAAYKVKAMENAEEIAANSDWGYYAKQLAGAPGQFLKAWVRWNNQEMVYDYSLNADAGAVFSHATPYVDTIFS